MRVVGVCVRVETENRPTARGVMLDDATGSATIVDKFEVPGDDVDFPQQLLDLSKSVSSNIQSLAPDRVLVRLADFPPMASRGKAAKLRLLAEGAICAAAREHIPDTHLGTGGDIGDWDGRGKAAVDADAKTLTQATHLALKWQDAVMTGLGAFVFR